MQKLDTRHTTFSGENLVRQSHYDNYHPTLASVISDKVSTVPGRRLSSVDLYLRNVIPPTPSLSCSVNRENKNENINELTGFG